MPTIIVGTILIISLFTTVFLGIFTIFYCENSKRNYFLLLVCSVFLFVLGYLLEITASNTDGGLTATKVMYLGSTFISPLYLLFAADYCEINMSRWYFIAPLVLIPAAVDILIWTTPMHTLIYMSYEYVSSGAATGAVPHLEIVPGILYYLNHGFALLCIIISTVMIASRMRKWDKKYLYQLLLLLVGALIPLVANLLYVLNLNVYDINYTPVSLVVFITIFYIAIIRYDIFNLLPKASAMALNSIKEAFLLLDLEMNFINANPSAYEVFPELKQLKKGGNITNLSSWPEEIGRLEIDSLKGEIIFNHNDGKYYSAGVNSILDKKRIAGWVLLIQDITSAHMLFMQMEEHASKDSLTGIFNRRHFMEIVEVELAKARRENAPCHIVMLDIDFFKRVNDTYGHQSGDQILLDMVTAVKNVIRPYDIFARYGGEEFVLFFQGNAETISMLAERIRLSIAEKPCFCGEIEIKITASIGVALVGEEMSIDDALKNADKALYRAKENGRNQVVFFEDMMGYQ